MAGCFLFIATSEMSPLQWNASNEGVLFLVFLESEQFKLTALGEELADSEEFSSGLPSGNLCKMATVANEKLSFYGARK